MRTPAFRLLAAAVLATALAVAAVGARADFVFDGPGLGNHSVQFGAPVIVVATATSSSGASVNFSVTETGVYQPVLFDFGCDTPTGSTFAVGITLVTCSAVGIDQFGNAGTDYTTILVVVDQNGAPLSGLLATLESAANQLNHGNVGAACNTLTGFLSAVQAQTGKKLTAAQAATLLTGGGNARLILNCH